MNFWKQFKPKCCSVNLKATDKPAALVEFAENLVKAGVLSADLQEDALKALQNREELGSTGVGQGVAIPHVKLKGIDRVVCSVSVSKEALEWSAIDGEPVNIFFTVLRPERAGEDHDPERHLEMMTWISKLAREPDFRRFAGRVKTKTELVDLLKEMSTV